jgi:hypothetical protein
MDDGDWLGSGTFFHNRLYKIIGGPENFKRQEIADYPEFAGEEGSWFGYGIVTIGPNVYSFVSKTPLGRWSGPFRGVKLLKSPDNGRSWYRVGPDGSLRKLSRKHPARNLVNRQEMFFFEECGLPHKKKVAYPFSYVAVVHCGRANEAAQDDYIYIYSPEGAHAHKLLLARVRKDRIEYRKHWEYFVRYEERGEPVWTRDLAKRGYVHIFPEKNSDGYYFGWYSWLPSVVWNPGLKLYIMVNGGTYAGHGLSDSDKDYYDSWMHERTGSLGFWYAEKPYGPWKQFFYKEYWTADDPGNLTYQPKLSPKWISRDGKRMVLIWSDAMKNAQGRSHSVNYRWNQMWISIVTKR